MKYRNMLVLFFCFFVFGIMYSKEFPKTYDVMVILTKAETKKMDKAKEQFKTALEMWNDLTNRYNPEKITNYKIDSIFNKDAYPILVKIAQIFYESNYARFEIYNSNCVDFWEKNKFKKPQGLEEGKRYQKEAVVYMDKANLNRVAANSYANEYRKAYDRYFEAISLEIIAAKKSARALQYFRDWPAHYPYVFDQDLEVDLFNPKKTVVAAAPVPEPVVETPKEEPKPVVVEHILEKAEIDYTVEKNEPDVVYYRVQLAAHTVRMNNEYLNANIYTGKMKVIELKEDGWYKYLVGKFKTLEEASQLLAKMKTQKELKASNAFVTAYKNGKRVQIKEAQKSNTK